jgi:hypothetical protein
MRISLVLVILLQCTAAWAAESVAVGPAVIRFVPLQRLHELCSADADFDACTRFVAYRLQARCESTTIRASITFTPLIFLYNIRQLPHEGLHIDDIRRFASAYVRELEAVTFVSADRCEAETLRLAAGFGEKMREFADRSNRERHPLLHPGKPRNANVASALFLSRPRS